MNKIKYYFATLLFVFATMLSAQEQEVKEKALPHGNVNKFKQMYEEFATPNTYRSASGAPGPDYYQQQADYKMDIKLDDKNAKIYGEETITYFNNSPDDLEFLWLQVDQNVRTKNTKSDLRNGSSAPVANTMESFKGAYLTEPFDGGFNIDYVRDASGKALPYTINQTMMRVDLPQPLKAHSQMSFSVKWNYNIPDHTVNRARSGYEYFPEDGNRAYVIAQFFPRMAVYSDVEGWQNHQFWGNGEFALTFGNYEVNITVPADHVLDGTGVLQNTKDVFPKAISVHAKNQGMEYPMICWNYGRPEKDGTYSDRVKYGMLSVIIHEVGHNFFPMIVNSDERQWGWMDEGLDTFMQYMAEQEFGEAFPEAIAPNDKYPSRRGEPSKIVPYMSGDQDYISPIMSNPENVFQLGNNAYGKPATALNILRETVMGRELFDHAFKTYSHRWMFKHPTPEDFFRTMEDASAVDLDWYWRGWFYTTNFVDIGVGGVKKYVVTDKPTAKMKEYAAARNQSMNDFPDLVYLAEEGTEDYDESLKGKLPSDVSTSLKEFMMDNMTAAERAAVKEPKFFYEVTFTKPGGIPMPLIVEYSYADGTTENITYPAEIWRKNDKEVSRMLAVQKELVGVVVDPKAETADIDVTNNAWPKKDEQSDFDKFKNTIKD